MLRTALWLSIVFIPIIIVLGAVLAVESFGWWSLIVVAIISFELLVILHTNLSELGLQGIANTFPKMIREARRRNRGPK